MHPRRLIEHSQLIHFIKSRENNSQPRGDRYGTKSQLPTPRVLAYQEDSELFSPSAHTEATPTLTDSANHMRKFKHGKQQVASTQQFLSNHIQIHIYVTTYIMKLSRIVQTNYIF